MVRDTGFPRADVENDFLRARRRQALSRLAHRLTREPDDVNMILPFTEVIAAVGMEGERYLGLQTIKLDTVVGTVDSHRDFDRRGTTIGVDVRGLIGDLDIDARQPWSFLEQARCVDRTASQKLSHFLYKSL